MVKKIIEFCSKNKLAVFITMLFFTAWSLWAINKSSLDALPDLSDKQVILLTEWKGQSPNLIEDQVTYPLVTTFLSAPRVKVVRGYSMFGLSFVHVIFDDDVDIYWARARVLEYLANLQGTFPEGVSPQLGPDATGVGWIYQYVLVDESGEHSLQDLRSFQDWYLRYWLAAVPGVAEVASVGGYEKEYQVEIDPIKLQAYDLSILDIKQAIRASNSEVGGRVIELAEHEYVVRGRGYITNKKMIEQIAVSADEKGTPVLLRDIARVQVGGNIRRGLAELNGEGEVVGGIVVMRYAENALAVINRVKEKLEQIKPALPKGVRIETVYDRSDLIKNSIMTLFSALSEEMLLVLLTILLFLFHFGSAFITLIALPLSVLFAFIPMYYMGLTINIMSLGGIIIAIGDVVDSAIVMIERAHRKLEKNNGKESREKICLEAAKEIGPSMFASLLIIVVSFLPVFTLQAQEGRMFGPLAFTKTFSVAFGALIGITLVPATMPLFLRGTIYPADKNPINRFFTALYKPLLHFCTKQRSLITTGALLLFLGTIPAFTGIGSEFMPPLDEESLMLMPITTPGISIETAKNLLQIQDRILYSFPEIKTVFGKAGRAKTATDPAPLSMIETVVTLKPRSEWRPGMTKEKLLQEIDKATSLEGIQNALTMPIKARLDMLSTGIRTPIGIKIFGDDLKQIHELGLQLENILHALPGTRSIYAQRELGGYFIDFIPDRDMIARFGLHVMDVFGILETAIGGHDITTTIEGRERYTINLRYPRELRHTIEELKNTLVPIGHKEHVPLGQLGSLEATMGPSLIKSEMGTLAGWVFIDIDTKARDIGGYVKEAKEVVAKSLKLPKGYFLKWTGQYEYLERIQSLMKIVIPITLLLIFTILFFIFGNVMQTLIVMISVPFSGLGAIWLMYLLHYNFSVAVWVGIIALLGIAAQTVMIMMVNLDEGYNTLIADGKQHTVDELVVAISNSATKRLRPLLMAITLNIMGLLPIMASSGVGADVAKRIAAPLWGGLISLIILTLLIIPAVYVIWRSSYLKKPTLIPKQMT